MDPYDVLLVYVPMTGEPLAEDDARRPAILKQASLRRYPASLQSTPLLRYVEVGGIKSKGEPIETFGVVYRGRGGAGERQIAQMQGNGALSKDLSLSGFKPSHQGDDIKMEQGPGPAAAASPSPLLVLKTQHFTASFYVNAAAAASDEVAEVTAVVDYEQLAEHKTQTLLARRVVLSALTPKQAEEYLPVNKRAAATTYAPDMATRLHDAFPAAAPQVTLADVDSSLVRQFIEKEMPAFALDISLNNARYTTIEYLCAQGSNRPSL